MTRIKDPSAAAAAEAELSWLRRFIPLTRRVAADLSRTTLRGGDPVDAFDLTLALMLAGIEFMAQHHATFPAGIHLLPSDVEHRIAVFATGPLSSSQ